MQLVPIVFCPKVCEIRKRYICIFQTLKTPGIFFRNTTRRTMKYRVTSKVPTVTIPSLNAHQLHVQTVQQPKRAVTKRCHALVAQIRTLRALHDSQEGLPRELFVPLLLPTFQQSKSGLRLCHIRTARQTVVRTVALMYTWRAKSH